MKTRLDEETIAMRVVKEIPDGSYVNLGTGIGTLASNFVPPDKEIIFHSEAGTLGYRHILSDEEKELFNYNLTNPQGQFLKYEPGMSFFDFSEAFDMIRRGRVDVTVLGAYQVSEGGDLANWSIYPDASWGGIGGAMDIAVGAKKTIIAMTHTTKEGKPKIMKACTFPLTCKGCVDLLITDVAVIEVTGGGLILKEVAPGWTAGEVQAITEPKLIVAQDLKEIEL